MKLKGKSVFITGGSRGIGREIALKFAREGANVAIAAKTAEPHPKLEGTIYSVAEEIRGYGVKALALQVDIRFEEQIQEAIRKAVEEFGGLDILINNASAIQLTPTLQTPAKKFDLMMGVNARGTFLTSQACIPYLAKAKNPHILTLSPPLNMKPKWFKQHLAYTMSKYGMSMCTLGMSVEFAEAGIAVNSLWPKTTIATAAISAHFPKEIYQASRSPTIMADAALAIVTKNSRETTGQFFIDEEVLRAEGIIDFDRYALNPNMPCFPDLYIDQ